MTHDALPPSADPAGRPSDHTLDGPLRAALGGRCRVALVLAFVAGLTLAGAFGTAVAAQEGPTVRVTDANVEPGGTATVRVVLTSAPDGLAGYELVVSVEDGEAATITGASHTDAFGLTTEPAVSEDGRTLRLEATDVDGNVQAGATNVTLATVELRGESDGEADLAVRPVQFDADGGAAMDVDGESGSVIVGEPEATATPTAEATATTVGSETVSGSGSGETEATGTADEAAGSPTLTGTSGQGSLPLAGVGVAGLALVLVAALLVRRR